MGDFKMEKPNIKQLIQSFERIQEAANSAISANSEGMDLKDICMDMLFELNLATLKLNTFILYEESVNG